MKDTHQTLAYVNNVDLTSDIRILERNADVLLNACKDIGLEVLYFEFVLIG